VPPFLRSRRGLGATKTQAEISAVGAEAATGILTYAPFAGPAAPLVAAVAGIVAVASQIAAMVFHGANPLQVPAAQGEQIFEIWADNLYAVAKAGMLDPAAAAAAMGQLISMGTQYIASLNVGKAGQAGIANMTKVINAEISAVQSLPAGATKPIDLTAARALYTRGGGWYPESVTKAAQYTDAFLQSAAAQQQAQLSSLGTQVSSAVTQGKAVLAEIGIPPWAALAAAGLLAWWFWE
jgi:phosphoribosylformylglycinamidine (FGAM) synthase PurS component